jgi:N-acetylneuraminic acid mutarotase
MAPIEEQGAVWEYDTSTSTWCLIEPATTKSAAVPAARSYHCMTSNGKDTLYIHAGCPESGRLSDLWAFNVPRKEWTELAPAFDPPRGGTSITFADGKLYRMNGFDGKTEQGGNLDTYTPETNSWDTHVYTPDGKQGPSPRSVSALLAISVKGRSYLITLFGERDPSSLGHQGAGKMLGDVWGFDIENKKWEQVDLQGSELPLARGWFDADIAASNSILVHGGLGESNDRLGDVWKFEFAWT